MKRKIWVLLLVLFVVVFGLGYFRYENVASKTDGSTIYKIKLDQWTGTLWIERYYVGSNPGFTSEPMDSSSKEQDTQLLSQRSNLTKIWQVAIGINALALIVTTLLIPNWKGKKELIKMG